MTNHPTWTNHSVCVSDYDANELSALDRANAEAIVRFVNSYSESPAP